MKVLIIGFGSIGRRHYDVLCKFKLISEIKLFTKSSSIKRENLTKIKEIKEYDPDYIVISNETNLHYKFVNFIENNFAKKIVLVEKPLFHKFINYSVKKNKFYLGYNLRFHPIIQKIKKFLIRKKTWSVNIVAGSYLPDWKKNRDYKKSYNAKNRGGGVLLDLSHELDYLTWIFGNLKPIYSFKKKLSNLKINSNDYVNIFFNTKNNTKIQINLSYNYRIPTRSILIDGKDFSIRADLINNTLIYFYKNKIKKFAIKKYDIDNMYFHQHKEIINNNTKDICTFDEGKKIMKLIKKIHEN